MSTDRSVRITGTDDPVEIAAALAVLSGRPDTEREPTGYDKWRVTRVTALRRSRRH